jgi:hypothetical protein
MDAGKNSVIYMGIISGPNKADDTCGRTTVTGTMDRGFTVYIFKGTLSCYIKWLVYLCILSHKPNRMYFDSTFHTCWD